MSGGSRSGTAPATGTPSGAGVVQRGEADPAQRGRPAPAAGRPRGHAGVRPLRYVDYWGTTVDLVRHPRAAHRARRAGDVDGRDRPAAAGAALGSAGPSWPGPRSGMALPSTSPPRPTSRPSRSSPSSAGPCAPGPPPCRPGSAWSSGSMRRCATSGARRTSAPPRPRPAPRAGRMPGLRARHAGPAARRRAARAVRLRLPPPVSTSRDRGDDDRREPRLGRILGRRLGRGRPDQSRRGGQPGRAAGPRS